MKHSKLITMIVLIGIFIALETAGAVTLTVGNDSAPIGSQGNQILITLDNDEPLTTVQLDLCDEDDFISCADCEGVDRTSGFGCISQELSDGCCRIMLFLPLSRESIQPGTGPIIAIEYDVSEEAPEGECRSLTQQNVSSQTPELTLESGEVCFTEGCSLVTTTTSIPPTTTTIFNCSVDDDCNDGLFCNGVETCVDGLCQAGNDDPCDDSDICTIDGCDEDTDTCPDKVCDQAQLGDGATSPCCQPGEICHPDGADPSVVCGAEEVTLIKESGYYQPPECPEVTTIKNKVCLNNPAVLVSGIQFDVCDTPDCLECIACELTERTVMFDCVVSELPNGCCRVIMFCKNPGCAVNPGLCNIATIVQQTKCPYPEECNACIEEDFDNIVADDYEGFPLSSVGYSGEVCFNLHIDEDEDGVDDDDDNCPAIPNGPNMGRCTAGTIKCPCLSNEDCGMNGLCSMNQEDADDSGIGDACNDSMDQDGDEWEDSVDNCPTRANSSQEDIDGDGIGDVCDNCPDDSNIDQSDLDTDGVGDVCDSNPMCSATAIYGEFAEETQLLRSLRDNVLSKTFEGRELIKLYYQWSPFIVKAMEADEDFKEDIKALVDGFLGMVEVE